MCSRSSFFDYNRTGTPAVLCLPDNVPERESKKPKLVPGNLMNQNPQLENWGTISDQSTIATESDLNSNRPGMLEAEEGITDPFGIHSLMGTEANHSELVVEKVGKTTGSLSREKGEMKEMEDGRSNMEEEMEIETEGEEEFRQEEEAGEIGSELTSKMELCPDVETDPLDETERGPDSHWEEEVRSIQVRELVVPSDAAQRQRMRETLDALRGEPHEPNEAKIQEARERLDSIPS
jgi:hypothetical protein